MQTVKFNAGDTILSEGEDGNTAFYILDGSVEVSIGRGAQARSVGTLNAGDVFGEMSLIEPGPRSATVKAVTETECLETSYEEFVAAIQDDPERAIMFMKTLVSRLRHMNELLVAIDPGRRNLREIFRDWHDSYEDAEAARRDVEKTHPIF
jgi:CRP/FNR family transcriptional regulator, cyclic AMP receptor protein